MIKICMLTLVLACVAGVGTAQITVGLNIGSVGEKSDDVRYTVPDHKDLGSKYFGYLPFETGTALFGLIMTHKYCEMEKIHEYATNDHTGTCPGIELPDQHQQRSKQDIRNRCDCTVKQVSGQETER